MQSFGYPCRESCIGLGMNLVAGFYKLYLAQFADLQSCSQFSSDIGSETKITSLRVVNYNVWSSNVVLAPGVCVSSCFCWVL